MKRELFLNGSAAKENDFDRAAYEFACGLKHAQSELTYPKFMDVIDALKPKLNAAVGSLKKFDFINLALERKEVTAILNILGFTNQQIIKLKASEVQIVIQDFFFLNPQLKTKLTALSQEHSLQIMTDSFRNFAENAKVFPRDLVQHPKKHSSGSQGKISKNLKKHKR